MEKKRWSREELARARAVDLKKYGIDGKHANAIDAVMKSECVDFVTAVKKLLAFAEAQTAQNIVISNYSSDLDKALANVETITEQEQAESIISLPKDEWAKEVQKRYENKRARALEKGEIREYNKNDKTIEWLMMGNDDDKSKAEVLEILGVNSIADAMRMSEMDMAKAVCNYAETDLTPESLDNALRTQWLVIGKVIKKIYSTIPELEETALNAESIIDKTYEKLNPPDPKEYEPAPILDDILNPNNHLSSLSTRKQVNM
jgi:hypothetical protein